MKRILIPILSVFIFLFTCSFSLAAEYPSFNDVLETEKPDAYVLLQGSTGKYNLMFFYDYAGALSRGAEFVVTANSSNGVALTLLSEGGTRNYFGYKLYNYNTVKGWYTSHTTMVQQDNFSIGHALNDTYVASTVDIVDNEGNVVFQVPPGELYQIIQVVTTEEIQKQNQTLVGTMKTLTVCGIGLLALLIGLVVFGKVFHRFQVK